MHEPIYLDYNATTPVAPEVLEAMLPALRDGWGNPSSIHAYGVAARRTVDRARDEVAELLGCEPDEVVFTSGGTESDNAALVGIAEARQTRGRHVVISNVEHAAVEETCRYLESRGFTISRVGVDSAGRVSPKAFLEACRPDTILVSLMHAQNETGVLQPVREVARRARSRGIVVHSDAAQSVGKIPVRVRDLDVDALTVAGHKLYAPKGVGALYLRRGTPFAPYLRGAGHERGLRSGTESVPLIAALGAACSLASKEMDERPAHLRALRDRLETRLKERIGDLVVHGSGSERLPNTAYVALPGVNANTLLSRLDGVAAAAGAACHAGGTRPSRVLLAMGVSPDLALCTLRLTVGRPTRTEDVERAALRIAAEGLRLSGADGRGTTRTHRP